jgi:DNA-binding protein H-NS
MSSSIKNINEAKAKLLAELQALEEQEIALLSEKASEAYDQVVELLTTFGSHLSRAQRNEITALAGGGVAQPKAKKSNLAGKEIAPKYWLPHTQETWTGRGRTPRAFAAWEGTAAYNDWKKTHPDEKFPAYPG